MSIIFADEGNLSLPNVGALLQCLFLVNLYKKREIKSKTIQFKTKSNVSFCLFCCQILVIIKNHKHIVYRFDTNSISKTSVYFDVFVLLKSRVSFG